MPRVLVSPFHDPCLNLAMEEVLFQRLGRDDEYLFLYVNDPAVVLGRFQNPWLECCPSCINALGKITLLRRQSGGGTVYHDRGNLNFSFIQNIQAYNKVDNLKEICRVVGSLGLKPWINERHDLCVCHDNRVYKVSGSAFRHTKDRAFHHGTLLVDSQLGVLKSSLTPDGRRRIIRARGTLSKASPVINLKELDSCLSVETIIAAFQRGYGDDAALPGIGFSDCQAMDQGVVDWEALARDGDTVAEYQKLESEEWLLGKTPSFYQDLSSLCPPLSEGWVIRVQKAIITEVPSALSFLGGLPYGSRDTGECLKALLRGNSVSGISGDDLFKRLFALVG